MASEASEVPRTLPRGRHRLSRETVRASQRTRLLEAMVEVSARHGYRAVTITHVVERARVARRTFYEHFDTKEACFLAAFEYTAEEIITPLLGAFEPVDDVMQRADAYVVALLDSLARRPALARMLVVEVGAGGPTAISRRLEMHRRIAQAIVELNRQTRALSVDVPVLPPSRALAMVGALVELMHATIHDHGPEHLPRLRRELSTIVAMLVSEPPTP